MERHIHWCSQVCLSAMDVKVVRGEGVAGLIRILQHETN